MTRWTCSSGAGAGVSAGCGTAVTYIPGLCSSTGTHLLDGQLLRSCGAGCLYSCIGWQQRAPQIQAERCLVFGLCICGQLQAGAGLILLNDTAVDEVGDELRHAPQVLQRLPHRVHRHRSTDSRAQPEDAAGELLQLNGRGGAIHARRHSAGTSGGGKAEVGKQVAERPKCSGRNTRPFCDVSIITGKRSS